MCHYAVLPVIARNRLSKLILKSLQHQPNKSFKFRKLFFSGMKFRCTSVECPEVFNGPKPECIYQSQFDQCCGKYECSKFTNELLFLIIVVDAKY